MEIFRGLRRNNLGIRVLKRKVSSRIINILEEKIKTMGIEVRNLGTQTLIFMSKEITNMYIRITI